MKRRLSKWSSGGVTGRRGVPGRRGHAAAGFTLLEIIVALVIFGFLMAGLGQTLRFGLAAWTTQGRMSDSYGDLEAADRVVRQVVRNLAPPDDTGRPAIEGGATALTGRSRMPTPDSGLAETPVEVGFALSGNRLILRWRPLLHAEIVGPGEKPREAVLAANVARVSLEYWRQRGGWSQSWTRRELPNLIRLRLTFRGDNPPRWPEDRKSTRLNSSHSGESRMPSSA